MATARSNTKRLLLVDHVTKRFKKLLPAVNAIIFISFVVSFVNFECIKCATWRFIFHKKYFRQGYWELCDTNLTLNVPIPNKKKKINLNFYFHTLCGASKGFIKAFEAFKKIFEAPKRSVKIKISRQFI